MMAFFSELARTRFDAACLGFFFGIAVTTVAFALAIGGGLLTQRKGGAR